MAKRRNSISVKEQVIKDVESAARTIARGAQSWMESIENIAGNDAKKNENKNRNRNRKEVGNLADAFKSAIEDTARNTQDALKQFLGQQDPTREVENVVEKLGTLFKKYQKKGYGQLQASAEFWSLINRLSNIQLDKIDEKKKDEKKNEKKDKKNKKKEKEKEKEKKRDKEGEVKEKKDKEKKAAKKKAEKISKIETKNKKKIKKEPDRVGEKEAQASPKPEKTAVRQQTGKKKKVD